jgi:hypothetical protein
MDGLTRKFLYSGSLSSLKQRFMEKERRRGRPPARVSVLASILLGGAIEPVIPHLAAADAAIFGDLWFDLAISQPDATSALEPGDEIQLLYDALGRSVPAGVRVYFTPRPLADGWFSHWHDDRSAAVVSLAGWAAGQAVPVEAFVAYELILHGLRALGACWTPDRWMHDETRGCLFDFCAVRQEIERKLQAADLCPSCRATLGRAGVPVDRLQRLLEVVRTLAVPAQVVH